MYTELLEYNWKNSTPELELRHRPAACSRITPTTFLNLLAINSHEWSPHHHDHSTTMIASSPRSPVVGREFLHMLVDSATY
jgi:hypothetical protein